MRTLELFAGAGGLALGLKKAGFQTEALIEYDRHSCQTLRHNLGASTAVIEADVRNISFKDFQNGIEVVTGGPPCQPFSIGGKAKGNYDQRNMFPYAVDAIRQIQPVAFIFENVKGLLRASFSRYFDYIILQLTYPEVSIKQGEIWESHLARLENYHINGQYKGLKYNVLHRLLNAADFGVPQKRERVFIVGFREDLKADWHFPMPTHSGKILNYHKNVSGEYWLRHGLSRDSCFLKESYLFEMDRLKPWVTVRDAIFNLPDPRNGPTGVINHVFQPGAKAYTGHTGSILDEPSKTLKAGDHGVPGGENMVMLDDGTLRYYTVRESARIQTFPDSFEFPVSWTESMRQIGNAVPVDLAYIVANSIYKTLVINQIRQHAN